MEEIKDWKSDLLNSDDAHTRGGGGLKHELPAEDVSSFDESPTENFKGACWILRETRQDLEGS